MRSAVDREQYWLRLRCTDYPEHPPSIVCFDPVTGLHAVRKAWPQCQGFRADGTWDLCLPLSSEGFSAHPEWHRDRDKQWNPHGNPLLRVLDELQLILNDPARYTGRLQ